MAFEPSEIKTKAAQATRSRSLLATLSIALLVFAAAKPAQGAPNSTPMAPYASRPVQERLQPLTKAELLEGLKSIQRKQLQDIELIDQAIRKSMQETQSVSLRGGEEVTSGKLLQSIPAQLERFKTQKEELLLRREFLDQLIFQVDSKYTTQGAAIFLEQTLLDMAINELTAPAPAETDLWRFYTYLSIAVREIPEPREDLLGFLAGYIDFSTMKSPKSPLAYLNSRHYTNGAISQSARPVRKEDVGSLVEKRLREVGLSGATTRAEPIRADIEMRIKSPSAKPAKTQKSKN